LQKIDCQLGIFPEKPRKIDRHMKARRIGIFAGTFDPVHSGQIAFALIALEQAGLDQIYFMPERRPRHKKHVEHYGHRVAMIRQALALHPKLEVLETDDISFTVHRTYRRLHSQFDGAQLVLLMGAEQLAKLPQWEGADRIWVDDTTELVLGLRETSNESVVRAGLAMMPLAAEQVRLLPAPSPMVSDYTVQRGLREHRYVPGLLSTVARYCSRQWLYVQLR
jgi:nicotinate (nicotinamide) nucleotide adenylyltransferase